MSSNYIKQIKELLQNRTQEELAELLGVSFAALNRWINDHSKPRKSNLILLDKLYKELVVYPQIQDESNIQIIKLSQKLIRKNLWRQIQTNIALQEELILEHTYNSNSIEGSTFSKRETEFVLFQNKTIKGKNLKEHLEIVNHSNILKKLLNSKYPIEINEKLIKELHRELMLGIRDDAGEYSRQHRGIRGLDLMLCHPKDIEDEMKRLIKEFKKLKNLEDIGKFHSNFELIHPFGDGNGRIGRLLIVIQCLSLNLPPIIIPKSRLMQYYDTLYYAQTQNEAPFIQFLYEELVRTSSVCERYL